jgi:hypothetical protein
LGAVGALTEGMELEEEEGERDSCQEQEQEEAGFGLELLWVPQESGNFPESSRRTGSPALGILPADTSPLGARVQLQRFVPPPCVA